MPQDGLQDDMSLGVTPGTGPDTGEAAALPGGLKADEVFGLDQGLEFEPALAGNEASRSAQSFASLTSYTVPENRYALLREVSANVDSNGEVRIAVPGNDTVQFTGSIDVALPFGDAVLLPGQRVEVLHQSTDGTSSTQRATITAREV